MTPFLPSETPEWQQISTEFVMEATRLAESVPAGVQKALTPILEVMNCFYSNLIEGNRTYPGDMQSALDQASVQKEQTELVMEAKAHIVTQRQLADKLTSPEWDPVQADSIAWIHETFLGQMPESLRHSSNKDRTLTGIVVPGELRSSGVIVGHHVPPPATKIPAFLTEFARQYSGSRVPSPHTMGKIAASHHRLVWIHPFLDGNGRVARLFTDAMLDRLGIGGQGLWRISRGFARSLTTYKDRLSQADLPRQGDLDGRGNLSQKGLDAWCDYVLRTALDQVTFMRSLVQPDTLGKRIRFWSQERFPKTPRIGLLVELLFERGKMDRKTAASILGVGERQLRNTLEALRSEGILNAPPRGDLAPAIPLKLAPEWFPGLFPPEDEDRIRRDPKLRKV